jgi:hypothetical protein
MGLADDTHLWLQPDQTQHRFFWKQVMLDLEVQVALENIRNESGRREVRRREDLS